MTVTPNTASPSRPEISPIDPSPDSPTPAPLSPAPAALPAVSSPGVSSRWRSWLGFLLLVAVLLPVKLWRGSQESSIWVDEVFSLQLACCDVPSLIDLTGADSHPPLYYLALRSWIALGRMLGIDVGTAWARSMNAIPWLLLAAAGWFAGRRLLGETAGTAMAWALAGGAQMADCVSNLRSYAFAAPALLVCHLSLLLIHEGSRDRSISGSRAFFLWSGYALLGTVALWSHLLSAFVLLALGIAWIGLSISLRHRRSWFVLGGAASQVLILIAFLPWVTRLPSQIGYFRGTEGDWMPKATVAEWLQVPVFWFPYGQIRSHLQSFVDPLVFLGLLSLAIPMGIAVAGAFRGTRDRGDRRLLATGVVAIGIALGFLVLTWTIHRTGIMHTFYGPRYSVLVVGAWTLGLTAIAAWGLLRLRLRAVWLWLVLAPWFLTSLTGQVLIQRSESRAGLVSWLPSLPVNDLNPKEPLYVMPSKLISFFRNTLQNYDIHPVEDLSDLHEKRDHLAVLEFSVWSRLHGPQESMERKAIFEKLLSRETYTITNGDGYRFYTVYSLQGFDPEKGRAILSRRFVPNSGSVPPDAVSSARAENQWLFDGWSIFELTPEPGIYRWAMKGTSLIRFTGPVPAGDYLLHICGYRNEHPVDPASMTVQILGENPIHEVSQSPGYFDIKIPVHFDRAHDAPVARVTLPWREPSHYGGSGDKRHLTFNFSRAWIEPAKP